MCRTAATAFRATASTTSTARPASSAIPNTNVNCVAQECEPLRMPKVLILIVAGIGNADGSGGTGGDGDCRLPQRLAPTYLHTNPRHPSLHPPTHKQGATGSSTCTHIQINYVCYLCIGSWQMVAPTATVRWPFRATPVHSRRYVIGKKRTKVASTG